MSLCGKWEKIDGKQTNRFIVNTDVKEIGNQNFSGQDEFLEEIIMPNVEIIKNNVLKGLKGLMIVNAPKLKYIGNSEFENCNKLKNIYMPSISKIGAFAFSWCTSLKKIDISSASKIGAFAFSDCTSLKEIDISSASDIGEFAFSDCTSLKEIKTGNINLEKLGAEYRKIKFTMDSKKEQTLTMGKLVFNNCDNISYSHGLQDYGIYGTLSANNKFTFNAEINAVPSGVFNNSNVEIEEIDLNNVREVKYYSFGGLKKLKKVIGKNLVHIDKYAFCNCESLQEIEGNKIQSIETCAFSNCKSLNKINLTDVNRIEPFAFEKLPQSKNTSINANAVIDQLAFGNSEKDVLYEILTSSSGTWKEDGTYTFNDNLERVPPDFFKLKPGSQKLISLDLSNVRIIGTQAFLGCKKLKEVKGNRLENIFDRAFSGCEKLTQFIAPNIYGISKNAFEDCIKLEKFKSKSLVNLDSRAFTGCSNLQEVSLNKVNTIFPNTFEKCEKLKKIKSKSAKEIHSEAFRKCTSLEEVDFPNVTELGNVAFLNCKSLKTVRFKSLKGIATSPFIGCSNLKEIFIGNLDITKNQEKFNDIADNILAGTPLLDMKETPSFTIEDSEFKTTGDFSEHSPKRRILDSDYKFEKVSQEDELFPNKSPNPSDISQGRIGDCWLLSALSSLAASNPKAIEECFVDKGKNKDTVKIRLYKFLSKSESGGNVRFLPNGSVLLTVKKSIAKVTIPFLFLFERKVNAFSDNNALWVRLLEKAFAVYANKYNGKDNPVNTISMRKDLWGAMSSAAVFTIITGKPSKIKTFEKEEIQKTDNSSKQKDYSNSQENIFNSILKRIVNNSGVGTGRAKNSQQIAGLPSEHAYSVIGVILFCDGEMEIKSSRNTNKFVSFIENKISKNLDKGYKYIVVRNPHARNGVLVGKNTYLKSLSNSDGLSVIELSRFCNLFENLQYGANKSYSKKYPI